MLYAAVLTVMAVMMAACSGGGGAGTAAGTATITGSASFPVLGDTLAKRASAVASDTDVTVEVYGLDGVRVGSPINPTADSDVPEAQRTYSYSVPGLKTGVDYVVKVRRGQQLLKKIVEKKFVVEGVVAGQTVDAVSTAAVVVASRQLSTGSATVVLGDPLPAGKTTADISTSIVTVQPSLLETSITAAITGSRDTLDAASANYANIFNMVVVAVSDDTVGSIDKVLSGEKKIDNVPLFNTAAPTVAPVFTNMSSTNSASIATEISVQYQPPANDAEKAVMYVGQAKKYLAGQDIANASLSFELALAADSSNAEANMGAAITSGLMMLDDPDFKAILAKWEIIYPTVTQVAQGTSPIRLPFGSFTSVTFNRKGSVVAKSSAAAPVAPATASRVLAALKALQSKLPQQKQGFKSVAKELGMLPATAPTVSEMQTVIDQVIIPRIDKMMARLALIEGKTNNTFTITAAMQGNPLYGEDVVLRDGEYYTIHSALNCLQVLFKLATAYGFDVPTGYTYETIAQDPLAMINSPSVFILKSDGKAKMAAALVYAKDAAAKATLAFDLIKARSAGTGSVDVATWTDLEKDSFSEALGDITTALNGPITITSDAKVINLDVTKFFSNPLDRTDLPTLAYDLTRDAALSAKYNSAVAAETTVSYYTGMTPVTRPIKCYIEPTSDLPDYTLNGILPGNTAANNVAEFNGILPMISAKLLTGEDLHNYYQFTTDGTKIYSAGYNYQTGSSVIKSIDLDGVVATHATGTGGMNTLLWYQGKLHAVNTNNDWQSQTYTFTVSPINITGGTYTVDSPVFTSAPQSTWININAITANGDDIYYAQSKWDQLTRTDSTDIRKISSASDDTLLFTISDWVGTLSVSGSYLYAGDEKYNLASPNAWVGSYLNDGDVLVGGYFYGIDDGRITKYAGTPSLGTAKLLGRFF